MPSILRKHLCIYWDESSIREAVHNGRLLDKIFSRQFVHVRPGDTIWILGGFGDRFVCIGFVRVARVVPRNDTWFVEAQDPIVPTVVDLTDEWEDSLAFESKFSLAVNQGPVPNGQQLQSMRRLSRKSELWLFRHFPLVKAIGGK